MRKKPRKKRLCSRRDRIQRQHDPLLQTPSQGLHSGSGRNNRKHISQSHQGRAVLRRRQLIFSLELYEIIFLPPTGFPIAATASSIASFKTANPSRNGSSVIVSGGAIFTVSPHAPTGAKNRSPLWKHRSTMSC